MDASDHKKRIANLVREYGCVPAAAPDGPLLLRFNAGKLGAAIERECARARVVGWTKITLHMDLQDAALLARHLRRK